MPMSFQPQVRLQTQTGLAIGFEAGKTKVAGPTGSDDVFIGYLAGRSVPDGQTLHTLVGAYAGAAIATGAGSTFLGQKAGISVTNAQSSVAIGSKAAVTASSLIDDTFVGFAAGGSVSATNLGRRTYVGVGAGESDCGDYNVYVGWKAGKQTSVNEAANSWGNVGVGAQSLNGVTGFGNVAAGHFAGNSIASGIGNVALGYRSGQLLTVGSNNVLVGYEAGIGHTNTTRCIFLGEHAGNTVPNGSQNIFVAGSGASAGGARIDQVFFGKGYAHVTPTGYTISGTGGLGENVAGADVRVAGGTGTGTAKGGKVILAVSSLGGSGAASNPLVDAVTLNPATASVAMNMAVDADLVVGTSGGRQVALRPQNATGRLAKVLDSGSMTDTTEPSGVDIGVGVDNTVSGLRVNTRTLLGTSFKFNRAVNGATGPLFAVSEFGVDRFTINSSGHAKFAGPFSWVPGSSVTPSNVNEIAIEKTSDTLLTFKVRGSDGVLRTATIAVAA